MKDCSECQHGQKMSYGHRFCVVMSLPRPVTYMRHSLSECGIDGRLFDPVTSKVKYADYDND